MKKFLKIGCLGLIALIVLIIVIAIFSSGGDDDVSTGTDSDSESTEEEPAEKEDGKKIVDATDQSVSAAGMNVGLGEIEIIDRKIKVGINLENTTDNVLSFYPDQGSAVIDDMQLDANMFLTDGSVGGDVQGGVKQDGILEFLVPDGKKIDVESVKELKIMLGDVTTEDYMTSETVEFVVPVE